MPVRRRLYFSLVAVLISLLLGLFKCVFTPKPINDFLFPLCGGKALLHGEDPYVECPIVDMGHVFPPNPLTTILVALPFSLIPSDLIGGIFLWSAISGLLVYALLKDGQWWRLLFFTSACYWEAFKTFQWSPFLCAIYLLPDLLPLALVKPQIGLPVILSHLNKRRLAGLAAFGLLTLVIDPTWPLRFLAQAGAYDGVIPLLILPAGPLALLALLRYRDPGARLLAMMAVMPQRSYYDMTLLWLIPKSARQMLFLSAFSWGIPLFQTLTPHVNPYIWFILLTYGPATILVLWPNLLGSEQEVATRREQPSDLPVEVRISR